MTEEILRQLVNVIDKYKELCLLLLEGYKGSSFDEIEQMNFKAKSSYKNLLENIQLTMFRRDMDEAWRSKNNFRKISCTSCQSNDDGKMKWVQNVGWVCRKHLP